MPSRKRKAPPKSTTVSNDEALKQPDTLPKSDHEGSSDDSSGFSEFTISSNNGKSISCESRGGKTTIEAKLIFTHGAGGGLEAPATKSFAEGAATISPVVSFQGPMNLKTRTQHFLAVIDYVKKGGTPAPSLGGRSMGARAAVLASQEYEVSKDLVLVSYPLTSPSGDVRDQILLELPDDKNVLFISGDRDSMCDLKHLNRVREKMRAKSWLVIVEGADHGMSIKNKNSVDAVRKRSGAMAAEWLANHESLQQESILRWDAGTREVAVKYGSTGSKKNGLTDWLQPKRQEKSGGELPTNKRRKKV